MNFKLSHIAIFFLSTALCAVLLIPTGLDRVVIFRNSYMFDQALAQLDRLDSTGSGIERMYFTERLDNLYLSGRYRETVELLEDRIRMNPEDSAALRRLGRTYVTTMEPENVVRTFEKLLEVSPSDSEALYQLDYYYRNLQLTGPLITNLLRLTRHYPDDIEKWQALADLYIDTAQPVEAVNTLEKAAARFPDSLQLSLELGRILVYEHRGRAYEFVSGLHERFPERTDIFDLMVQALLDRGEYEVALEQVRLYYGSRLTPDAYRGYLVGMMEKIADNEVVIRFLEERVTENPSPENRFWLASLYQNDQRYADALEQLRILVRERPERQSYWKLYLYLLWEEQYKTELAAALEEYCRRWPDDLEHRFQLAKAYDWNENYESEAETLRELLEEEPARTDYGMMLARALNNLGRYEQASQVLEGLVSAHPDSLSFRRVLIETVQAIPDEAAKERYIGKLYETAPGEDAEIAFTMASNAARNGNADEVNRIFRVLFALHDRDTAMLVRAGELCRSYGLEEPAAGYYRQALALDPENWTALIGLAEISAEGNSDVSRTNLERLESHPVENPDLAYRMALVYDAISDKSGAFRCYKRYLELADSFSEDSYSLRRSAWALYRIGDTGRALELYRRLVREFPGDRNLVNDYAEILIADKQYDRALQELDRIKP